MSEYWTEKNARAKCRRKLKSIQNTTAKLAGEVAYEWGDVDRSIVESCDEMISHMSAMCLEIEAYMTECVEGEADV